LSGEPTPNVGTSAAKSVEHEASERLVGVSSDRSGGPLVSVFTLFPDLIEAHATTSVLGRARKNNLVQIAALDLRSHGTGTHRSVDDSPFGGGAGMVLTAPAIVSCIEAAITGGHAVRPVILLGPSGRTFNQRVAEELAALAQSAGGFSLLCGRYEGFDQRVHDTVVDEELSLGDFVLGGGEVAAMAVIEAVTRLLPGVMGNESSAEEESFSAAGLLEYPQYTRPLTFREATVPDVLRSGDHARIARWRHAQALVRTATRRPDLLVSRGGVTAAEAAMLKEFGLQIDGVEWPPDKPKKRPKRPNTPTSLEG
jgi:tRNA (guanine37-N1)-methyltransferase